ncbi:hypothetical protein BDE02_17G130500 [Populus trichocarpa]|jgi:hypothetical protein|nr:hypothetical protein BDE02_17G130500 [Populus trichocarpa]
MDCAKAVADGDLKLADFLFEEMEVLTAKETRKVTETVVSCFAEALAQRAYGVLPRNPVQLLPSSIVNTNVILFNFSSPTSTLVASSVERKQSTALSFTSWKAAGNMRFC